jgi:hypothetical protein
MHRAERTTKDTKEAEGRTHNSEDIPVELESYAQRALGTSNWESILICALVS